MTDKQFAEQVAAALYSHTRHEHAKWRKRALHEILWILLWFPIITLFVFVGPLLIQWAQFALAFAVSFAWAHGYWRVRRRLADQRKRVDEAMDRASRTQITVDLAAGTVRFDPPLVLDAGETVRLPLPLPLQIQEHTGEKP